jgi:penicillin-binding protein 1A
MTAIHQNIDLKPIPGVDVEPPDAELVAKARAAEEEAAAATAANQPSLVERPPTLSAATTKVLRSLTDALRHSRKLEAPVAPETLSAL